MVRMSINILDISEIKWMGMGEFNSDDHYVYYWGKESVRRNGVILIVNMNPKCSHGCNLKNNRMILVHFQNKRFSITIIQIYAPIINAKEAEAEWFYKDLPELAPKQDVLFIIRYWNARAESQKIPGVTGKFGLEVQNEALQRPTEFCQENTLVIANPLQQHKRWLYIWTSPDGWYQNHVDYILCSWRWRSSI